MQHAIDKLMKIEKAEISSGIQERVALACEYKGDRYHIWIDRKTLVMEPMIYKNPARDLKRDHPDHYNTRKLRTGSDFTDSLIAAMFHALKKQNLIAKYEAKKEKAEAERLAKANEEHRIEMMRQAGPDLYVALNALVAEVLSLNDDARETKRTFKSLKAADQALKKAEASQ